MVDRIPPYPPKVDLPPPPNMEGRFYRQVGDILKKYTEVAEATFLKKIDQQNPSRAVLEVLQKMVEIFEGPNIEHYLVTTLISENGSKYLGLIKSSRDVNGEFRYQLSSMLDEAGLTYTDLTEMLVLVMNITDHLKSGMPLPEEKDDQLQSVPTTPDSATSAGVTNIQPSSSLKKGFKTFFQPLNRIMSARSSVENLLSTRFQKKEELHLQQPLGLAMWEQFQQIYMEFKGVEFSPASIDQILEKQYGAHAETLVNEMIDTLTSLPDLMGDDRVDSNSREYLNEKGLGLLEEKEQKTRDIFLGSGFKFELHSDGAFKRVEAKQQIIFDNTLSTLELWWDADQREIHKVKQDNFICRIAFSNLRLYFIILRNKKRAYFQVNAEFNDTYQRLRHRCPYQWSESEKKWKRKNLTPQQLQDIADDFWYL